MDFNNYGNENRRNDYDGQGNSESTDNDMLSNVSPNTGGDREHEINRDADTAAAQSTNQYAGADSAQNMNQYTNGYAGHGMNQHINGQMGSGLNQHTNDSANYGTGHNINNDMGYGGYPNNSNGNYGPNRTGQSPYGYPYPPLLQDARKKPGYCIHDIGHYFHSIHYFNDPLYPHDFGKYRNCAGNSVQGQQEQYARAGNCRDCLRGGRPCGECGNIYGRFGFHFFPS